MIHTNSGKHKNAIIVILVVLLAISVFLNGVTYTELRRFYEGLYATILDPIGLSYFRDETSNPPESTVTVVFFGDSRAAQWIAPDIEGYYFVNRGIGNQSSFQVLLRFEEHIKPLNPKFVIIQVCINDLKTIPLFPERKQGIVTDCEKNIQNIVQKSLEADSTVLLTTVFPTSGNVPLARQLVWSDEVYEAVNEVNDFIRNYTVDGVIIFDAARILATADGNTKPEYVYDLLHLNNAGYDALNSELITILESLRLTDP